MKRERLLDEALQAREDYLRAARRWVLEMGPEVRKILKDGASHEARALTEGIVDEPR